MERCGVGPFALEVLVEMGHVGGDDDPAAAGVDADELQPGRVPARPMHADARGDRRVAGIERHPACIVQPHDRSEEHTSELQSLMRISYAVFCLKKTNTQTHRSHYYPKTKSIE